MKTKIFIFYLFFCSILVLIDPPLFASDNKTSQALSERNGIIKDIISITNHSIKLDGENLHYTATAGQIVLNDEKTKQKARIFFVAYEKKGKHITNRPVTFAFNGGPGSSSVWLHFGTMGPKRVNLNEDGSPASPPAGLLDNEFTWLAFTDLVFIDPVGTGYSRALDDKNEKQFYGFRKDIESVGDFIRLYLTRYNRWMSQKYIVGESYGTTRAVGLAEYLHTTHGIDLNGIVLISPVLDFNTILINSSNNLPYILFFPAYTEIALYHHKISFDKSIEEVRREVEDWAMDEYMPGIARGNTLSADRKNSIADTIAGYTGLSKDYILKNDLKIPVNRFQKELLRDQNRVIGRMDARFTGPDKDPAGEGSGYDPSLEMLVGTFASAVNYYVRNDLDFKSDTPYKYLNYSISREWNWQSGINYSQGYVNVSQALTDAIHINQYLNVFVASGYYDLATPYFAVQYTVNQLKLEKSLRDNISIHFYNAGHMMYTNRPSLIKLTEDISLFFKKR